MISALDRHKNHFRAIIIAPVGIKFMMRCEKGGDNALGILGQKYCIVMFNPPPLYQPIFARKSMGGGIIRPEKIVEKQENELLL